MSAEAMEARCPATRSDEEAAAAVGIVVGAVSAIVFAATCPRAGLPLPAGTARLMAGSNALAAIWRSMVKGVVSEYHKMMCENRDRV